MIDFSHEPPGTGRITITGELSDAVWGSRFGLVQRILAARTYQGQAIQRVSLNLVDCEWADPTPLLSFAISFADFSRNGGKVDILLPECDLATRLEDCSPGQRKVRRFLRFLSAEGFLEILSGVSTAVSSTTDPTNNFSRTRRSIGSAHRVFMGKTRLTQDVADRLTTLSADIAYVNCSCLPAEMLDLTQVDTAPREQAHPQDVRIQMWLTQRMVEHIDPVVDTSVPSWARHDIVNRLQVFLREAIQNVAEHAYRAGGFAAVYIRFRRGLLDATEERQSELKSALLRENNEDRVPLLRERFLQDHTGFLEAFLVDSGAGLCATLQQSKESNRLHKAMVAVFRDGASRKSERPTETGGLHLLGQLLERSRDAFRVYDDDAWWGCILPFGRTFFGQEGGGVHVTARGTTTSGATVAGVAWAVRMSWSEATDSIGKNPWKPPKGGFRDSPLLAALSKATYTDNGAPLIIFDARSGTLKERPWGKRKGLSGPWCGCPSGDSARTSSRMQLERSYRSCHRIALTSR